MAGDTQERTVRHAMFEYVDEHGQRRYALRGDTVHLTAGEVERGDRFGALVPEGGQLTGLGVEAPAPAPVDTPVADVEPLAADLATSLADAIPPLHPAAAASGTQVEAHPAARPQQVAPKAAWVEHAVDQGADREEAEAMTKADLIAQYSS